MHSNYEFMNGVLSNHSNNLIRSQTAVDQPFYYSNMSKYSEYTTTDLSSRKFSVKIESQKIDKFWVSTHNIYKIIIKVSETGEVLGEINNRYSRFLFFIELLKYKLISQESLKDV